MKSKLVASYVVVALAVFAYRHSFADDLDGKSASVLPDIVGEAGTALTCLHWEESGDEKARPFVRSLAKDLQLNEFTWRFIRARQTKPIADVDDFERGLLDRVPLKKPKGANAVFAIRDMPDQKQLAYVPIYARESCLKCHLETELKTHLETNGHASLASDDLIGIAVVSVPLPPAGSAAPMPKKHKERGQ